MSLDEYKLRKGNVILFTGGAVERSFAAIHERESLLVTRGQSEATSKDPAAPHYEPNQTGLSITDNLNPIRFGIEFKLSNSLSG